MLTEIQIDAQELRSNYAIFRSLLGPSKKIIAVVKANAYGHGLREVVRLLEDEADAFAVDDIQELHAIRFLTEKPVYVLGYVAVDGIDTLIDLKGTPVVYSPETIRAINQRALAIHERVSVTIKIEALLGRQGVFIEELPELLTALSECSQIELIGLYAHFANIEDTTDAAHAQKQIALFTKACAIVEEAGFSNIEKHISSTAGSFVFDSDSELCTHVRIGLGLYGLWPSENLRDKFARIHPLKPCLRWVTHVAQVKTLPAGHPIGYGLTYVTERETRVAVIPQGYSDGYARGLSNRRDVLIHGVRCRIIGRVAMNMFVVDVSHVPDVRVEDEVILIGQQGSESITAEELALHSGTINYEVVSRINPLLPRVIVGEDTV